MALLAALVLGAAAALWAWQASRADPVVRRARYALADWPPGAPPIRVALLSDLHLGNFSTDGARARRVMEQVRAQSPDLVLLAGDFVAGLQPGNAAGQAGALAAALRVLRPPLGIIAVLGNHDNWTDPATIRLALASAGVTVVENSAVRAGPLLVGGVGDTVSGHARLGGTLNALRRLRALGGGATVYLSHSPDIEKWLPPGPSLLLAGHTHCGQIVLPVVGAPRAVSSVYGNRLRCGQVADGEKTVVVTAGTGSSFLPMRLGAAPDFWLLTLGPRPARQSARRV